MEGWQRVQGWPLFADTRSQSSLGKGVKKVICSFMWSPGEKSQPMLDGCSRVKQAWGGVEGWGGGTGVFGVSQRGWLALSLLASACRGTAAPPEQ